MADDPAEPTASPTAMEKAREKYPWLERDPSQPDLLSAIGRPRAPAPGAP